jgi:hypothetical protein
MDRMQLEVNKIKLKAKIRNKKPRKELGRSKRR